MGEMIVTKHQQLEWLAKAYKTWPEQGSHSLRLSAFEIGKFAIVNCHIISRQEWRQERDKMQKQEVDNSLCKRGARPPIGEPVELWFGGSFAYNCEFICVRGMNYIVWNLDADRPDCADIMNSEFRPLRSEREKAIDDMKSLCAYPGSWCSTFKAFAESLYDAGYRKVKP